MEYRYKLIKDKSLIGIMSSSVRSEFKKLSQQLNLEAFL